MTNDEECYSRDLSNPDLKLKHMKKVCEVIVKYDKLKVNDYVDCVSDERFCQTCCKKHFGTLLKKDINNCDAKCNIRVKNAPEE